MYDEITMFDEISEKQVMYIVKKMNEAKGAKNFDKELQNLVNWVWDNEPMLSKDQNVKGIKFLKNLAFMANGKSRSNSPFGSREEYTVKNFAYMKLRGFHDVSKYGQVEQYVPLYTVFDDEGYGFEYFYHAGKVNVVGEKGMSTKKGSVEVNFFDTDKKVKDFLNLSRVQFMARYKVTKDNYQKMVSAITRNIEGVFSHGGQMGGAGQFGEGGEMNEYDVVYNSYDQETGDMIADEETVSVMASSILEAKNKAMTMLEEGSRDEDFTIVRVNDTDFGHRKMAKGGFLRYEGQSILLKSVPSPKEERFLDTEIVIEKIQNNKIVKSFVRNTGEQVPFVIDDQFKKEQYAKGGMIYKNWDMQNGEVTYKGKFVTRYHYDNSVDAFFLDIVKGGRGYAIGFTEKTHAYDYLNEHKNLWKFAEGGEMADGGHMATGGLTNIKGNAPVMKYPEIKSEVTIVE
jgi:hypothetical protein